MGRTHSPRNSVSLDDLATRLADQQPDTTEEEQDNPVKTPTSEGAKPENKGKSATSEDKDKDTEGEGEGEGKGNSEAAKYRTRLRAVEAERDGLAQRVARMQQAEVNHLVAERMADPEDLRVLGKVELADLLDDEGEVDSEKVEQAVTDLLERKPRLAADYQPDADGFDGGARQSVSNGGDASWSSVLGGRR